MPQCNESPDESNMVSFAVSFDIPNSTVSTDIVDNITKSLNGTEHGRTLELFVYEDIKVFAFQPNSKCCFSLYCVILFSVVTASCSCVTDSDVIIRTVCTGPSTPPCLCDSQSCKVSYYFITLHLIYVIFTV